MGSALVPWSWKQAYSQVPPSALLRRHPSKLAITDQLSGLPSPFCPCLLCQGQGDSEHSPPGTRGCQPSPESLSCGCVTFYSAWQADASLGSLAVVMKRH